MVQWRWTDAAPGFTRSLAERAALIKFESMPRDVIRVAAQAALDCVGVAIAGGNDPIPQLIGKVERTESGFGPCTLIGAIGTLPASHAALVNGAAAHALDYDDVLVAMGGHPSVTILPALLAIAQSDRLEAQALIAAYVAGFEIAGHLGRVAAELVTDRGFHATAILGAVASAGACAHLLGGTVNQIQNAIGLACLQAAGTKCAFGTMGKPFQAGNAAAIGLRSARMAFSGFSGPVDAIEAEQGLLSTHASCPPSKTVDVIGDTAFEIRDVIMKHHASCHLTHSSINAATKLRLSNRTVPQQIERVRIRASERIGSVCCVPDPASGLQSKFSIRHCVAMSLSGCDTSRVDAFDDATASDADLATLRQRIDLELKPNWAITHAEVTVRLADGTTLVMESDSGMPERDLELQERFLSDKFQSLVTPCFGAPRTEELRRRLLTLDREPHLPELITAMGANDRK
jgi:2-methylcitrate dehydratase PrpD